jgi:hypothetical protein
MIAQSIIALRQDLVQLLIGLFYHQEVQITQPCNSFIIVLVKRHVNGQELLGNTHQVCILKTPNDAGPKNNTHWRTGTLFNPLPR